MAGPPPVPAHGTPPVLSRERPLVHCLTASLPPQPAGPPGSEELGCAPREPSGQASPGFRVWIAVVPWSGQLLVLGGPVSFLSSGVRSASDPRGPVSFLSSGSGQLLILGVRSASCRRGSVRASALQSPPALTLIRKCLCSSFSSLVPDASRKGCLLLRRCVQPSSSVLFLHFLTK